MRRALNPSEPASASTPQVPAPARFHGWAEDGPAGHRAAAVAALDAGPAVGAPRVAALPHPHPPAPPHTPSPLLHHSDPLVRIRIFPFHPERTNSPLAAPSPSEAPTGLTSAPCAGWPGRSCPTSW